MKIAKLIKKKISIKNSIILKREVYRNLTSDLEEAFWSHLDEFDFSKCAKISVCQSRSIGVINCFRINGVKDTYYLGTISGVDRSIWSSHWK